MNGVAAKPCFDRVLVFRDLDCDGSEILPRPSLSSMFGRMIVCRGLLRFHRIPISILSRKAAFVRRKVCTRFVTFGVFQFQAPARTKAGKNAKPLLALKTTHAEIV